MVGKYVEEFSEGARQPTSFVKGQIYIPADTSHIEKAHGPCQDEEH